MFSVCYPYGMRSQISERGQVTIPKALRDRYGLREGVLVEFVADGAGISIRKAGGVVHPVDQVVGILGRPGSTDAYLEEIRGR